MRGEWGAARPGRLAAGLALALLTCCALAAGPAWAGPPGSPVIEGVEGGSGTEVTLSATINAEGHATTYEIWLECESENELGSPCTPVEHHEYVSGVILAGTETVSDHFTALREGFTYRYAIAASSSKGTSERLGLIIVPVALPSPCPTGCPAKYEPPPPPPWLEAAAREASERLVAEAARRQAEAEARASQEAHEREAAAAAAAKPPPPPRCVVPSLHGDTLTGARHALERAHCRLGSTTRPRHQHGTLRVIRQSARRGATFPAGRAIGVTLGHLPH
jgi:hypothetical protein